MADDLEQLVLSISADTRQMARALKRLKGETSSSTRAIEQRFDAMSKKINRSFDGMGRAARTALAAAASAFSIREAAGLVDTATQIQNSLKVAGLEGDALTATYNKLFDAAQRNAAPISDLVTLYSRVSLAQKELGVTSDQIVGLADTVAMSLRLSGGSAQEASGALLQLSQALGGGKVQMEEYGSLIDGAPALLQAAANGIEEAGGSVSKLTQLVRDGKLSSRAFFDGIDAGADTLRDKLAGAELTVSQGFIRLMNVLIDTAWEFNTTSGASRRFGDALGDLAEWIRTTDFSPIINGVMDFGREVGNVIGEIEALAKATGEYLGTDQFGK